MQKRVPRPRKINHELNCRNHRHLLEAGGQAISKNFSGCIYYGAIEWWRVEGSALWARAQTWLTENGIPIWAVCLAAAVLLLVVFGLLIKIFRRRPKPVAAPKETPKLPDIATTTPQPEPPLPEAAPEKPAATTPPTTPPDVVTTTPAPVIEEPETVTTARHQPPPLPLSKRSLFSIV